MPKGQAISDVKALPNLNFFICSTYDDLKEYRAFVINKIKSNAGIINAQEFFGSRDQRPLETCLEEVQKSHFFIMILGFRYGSFSYDTGKSFVECEYDKAKELKLPILTYMMDENHPFPPKYVSQGFNSERLTLFKERVKTNHNITLFTTPTDLADKVFNDLQRELPRHGFSIKSETKPKDTSIIDLFLHTFHELRTPLASIKGSLETLIEPDVNWSKKQTLDFLQSANLETDVIIYKLVDLIDWSRIESGSLHINKQNCTIDRVLASAHDRLSALAILHKLKFRLASDLPDFPADSYRISQVIAYMVANSVKFSPKGSAITISVKVKEDNIIISVADKGVGIAPETMNILVEMFSHADLSISGKRPLLGFGLAICQGIVEAHAGNIWFESQVGKGSKFSFSLPIKDHNATL